MKNKLEVTYKASKLIQMYCHMSEDPLKHVVCIPFNLKTKKVLTHGIGFNVIGSFAKELTWKEHLDKVMLTDKHPMKKLVMVHAEEDCLSSLKDGSQEYVNTSDIGVICSLQPCLNCVRRLLDEGIHAIYWIEDNRHQEEQVVIQDFFRIVKPEHKIDYRKVEDLDLVLSI